MSPMIDSGAPGSSRTSNRLCPMPETRSPTSVGRPAARYRESVGGSCQAKMSDPSSDRALLRAWPGSGLPKAIQSRNAHGA